MGEELLSIVLKLVDNVVNGELGISMSAKWAVDLAASNPCEAVGACYVPEKASCRSHHGSKL